MKILKQTFDIRIESVFQDNPSLDVSENDIEQALNMLADVKNVTVTHQSEEVVDE